MASQPFLDLANLNLDEVAVSKEEILRLNPHREEFEQIDKLVSLDMEAGYAVGIKTQRPDEF